MTEQLTRPSAPVLSRAVSELRGVLGPERVVISEAVRAQHAHGEGLRDAALPDVVVYPESNDEVAAILRLANAARIPVIPFGTGTSLEGHLQALYGGISLDLSRMNRVLEIHAADLDCRVEACVTREQLNAELRASGLFFPIDPGANASLGGMAATRASGTNAVRYGTMRDNVLGLTVVTADGRIIKTGTRARKSSAGYDLTRLFVGSEGTLGVITEVQLRLYGLPERVSAAVCQFDTLAGAVESVIVAMQLGIPLARIELLDEWAMRASIRYSKLSGFAEKPTLFFEFHGTERAVEEQIEQMRAITAEHGGSDYAFADRPEERSRLWKARHDAYWAGLTYVPGKHAFSTDACVPISRLAECVLEARALAEASGLRCFIVGHVGDGNFHVLVTFNPTSREERARADRLAEDVARLALSMGGTCTGEHGIGLHKLALLEEEHGPAVELMRAIKRALDPNGIMNPGKTVPMAVATEAQRVGL
ncbi:MAG: FAD-binding protein [Casimicrobiaceae bacterium]|nr:FAD-binding protein [Casimicrobiaceae bacterium]MDW8311673.1 FAD-linked oxidase C-terminal domain-containing protein [Burkholderiales bacterium]